MPGKNCCIPQCTVSQTQKHEGIKLHRITTRETEDYAKWRKDTLEIISKFRVFDAVFKARIKNGRAFICDKHYKDSDFEIIGSGKRVLRFGTLPSLNFPTKSQPVKEAAPRRSLIKFDIPKKSNERTKYAYKDLSELKKRIELLKINNWTYEIHDQRIHLKYVVDNYALPQYEVIVDNELEFTCIYFGWVLPDDCNIYKQFKKSLRFSTLSNLLYEVVNTNVCQGFGDNSINGSTCHIIPLKADLQNLKPGSPSENKIVHRALSCSIFVSDNATICKQCVILKQNVDKAAKKTEKTLNTPARPNAPLSGTHKRRIELALKEERNKNRALNLQIDEMKRRISAESVNIGDEFSKDIEQIMSENEKQMTPFMKLFWQQQKAAQCKGFMQYHPMIIRFCLSLAAKSASAYDELRSSGVLTLPSRRTLRDYKNVVKPSVGYNPDVIKELKKIITGFQGYQKYVCLAFDEVKVQENLVFDKYSGELVGFVDLGDPELNYSCFDENEKIATHILTFYIRGIASKLKFALAYFATTNVKGFQLMPIFWEAVAILELSCDLKVVAAVSDGAAPNRSFYQMHQNIDGIPLSENGTVYRTINLFSPDRFIWFFADAPHLMKTIRNCIYQSSKDGKRHLWNDCNEILWYHFVKIVKDDINNELKTIPKLTLSHINLTPYSKMSVRLATQILSESTCRILREYYPHGTFATSELCYYANKFFDCLNSRNEAECVRSKNENCAPYRVQNDARLHWLKNEFLGYLHKWKNSIESRPGNFTETQKDKMFLSHQTYKGIFITVNSTVEIVRYLLNSGMPFVLTERFNQDLVEEYFGRQRSLGRRNDNPTVYQFGYQSNTIRLQRSVYQVEGGNTSGRHLSNKNKRSWSSIDNEPLSKRKPGKEMY